MHKESYFQELNCLQNYYESETGDVGGRNGIGSGRKPLAGGERMEIDEWFTDQIAVKPIYHFLDLK